MNLELQKCQFMQAMSLRGLRRTHPTRLDNTALLPLVYRSLTVYLSSLAHADVVDTGKGKVSLGLKF